MTRGPAPGSKPAPAKAAAKPEPRARQAADAWLLQCPPGLASVLKKEMIFVGAIDRKQDLFIKLQRNHDLVFANKLKDSSGMPRLRISETALRCPVFGRFKISRSQLETMAEEMKKLGPRRLVAQVAGRHFDRRDIKRWIEKELSTRGYDFSDEIEDEVWMFCIDESYYFGVPQVKARAVLGRDDRSEERQGSLPPPVAAALAFAGMAKNDDVIVDPTCGSGTVLAEARFYAPEAERFGFDIDAQAVQIARANLGAQVKVMTADSRATGLQRQDVSLVLANLPFGVQFGDKATNAALYRDILKDMLRMARPEGWRAALLTSDTASLRAALDELRADGTALQIQELFKVKIRGELAVASLVKRRDG